MLLPPVRTWLELPFGWQLKRPSREGYGLAAIVLIGFGCAHSFGLYRPTGLVLIALGACFVVLAATGSARRATTTAWCAAVFIGALSTGFLFHTASLGWLVPIVGGIGAVLAIVVSRTLVRVCGCVLAGSMNLAILVEHVRWGRAPIDVFDFAQRASLQLLHGKDPYLLAYPTTTPNLPTAHYPFWPGVFLLSIPGRLVGDVRVSNLLAAAALITALTILAKRSGGGQLGWRCLALCLTLPFWSLMIRQAWAEIFFIAAVALWLVLRESHRTIAVLILGIGMATVATGLALLVMPFLWFRRARVEMLAAVVPALVICLPFVFWVGPAHFLSYTVLTQVHLPPRPDGLDLDSAWVRLTDTWLPFLVWPLVSGVALLLMARTLPQSWSNAFYRGATFLVIAFLYAKWAFFNYYFLVVIGVIAGIALDDYWRMAPAVAPSRQRSGLAHPPAVAAGETTQ